MKELTRKRQVIPKGLTINTKTRHEPYHLSGQEVVNEKMSLKKRASTSLPEYNTVNKPTIVEWGKDCNCAPILIQILDITEAYK